MKDVKRPVIWVMAVGIVGCIGAVMIARRPAARDAESRPIEVAQRDSARSAATPAAVVVEMSGEANESLEGVKPVNTTDQTNRGTQKAAGQASQGGPRVKEPLRDPLARVALALVGMDADAEAYWYGAINDSNLSPNERQDLIEDLNEDGLSDPKHPTADDLPLIVSRLLIIEEVWWDAKDDVNADAFREAYKDLMNLANVASGGGAQVR